MQFNLKMRNIVISIKHDFWKSQKLIPGRENQSFTIAKVISHKIQKIVDSHIAINPRNNSVPHSIFWNYIHVHISLFHRVSSWDPSRHCLCILSAQVYIFVLGCHLCFALKTSVIYLAFRSKVTPALQANKILTKCFKTAKTSLSINLEKKNKWTCNQRGWH